MATLLKLRGLERNTSQKVSRAAAGTKILPGSGFRVKHGLLSPTRSGGSVTKGAIAAIGGTGATNQITVTSVPGGSVSSNIKVAIPTQSGAGTGAVIVVTAEAATGKVVITATPNTSTTSGGLATLLNNDPNASQYISATAAGDGLGTALGNTAATALSAGADTGATSVEPFYVYVSGAANQVVVVDLDDTLTLRALYRNKGRFISLGQP